KPIATGRPMTFLEACLFQWVNPKAIAMAVTTVTVYAPDRGLTSMLGAVAVFTTINLPSVSLWVLIGVQLRQFLADPSRLRTFNITMAVLLVASLIPVVL
ncbi:MAG: LysE family translocator, partial [Pseudomonadota bacterium]